jgi:hypothetical protein
MAGTSPAMTKKKVNLEESENFWLRSNIRRSMPGARPNAFRV